MIAKNDIDLNVSHYIRTDEQEVEIDLAAIEEAILEAPGPGPCSTKPRFWNSRLV